MVKKSIIALAVVALLVTTVQAADPSIKKDGNWPWTYKAIDLCRMPIFMDVGHYVQLKDCQDRKIHLKQVDCPSGRAFPCYTGCDTFKARANFPAIFGGNVVKDPADWQLTGPEGGEKILDKTAVRWPGPLEDQILGSTGDWEDVQVCVDAWEVALWKITKPDDKLKVGELVITVKPPDTN